MDATMVGIAGFAMFFNFAILKWKASNGRVPDALLDGVVFGIILYVTSGSMNGMVIGIIGSMLFSLYLLRYPFELGSFEFDDEPKKEGV